MWRAVIPKHLITGIGHDRQRVHISQPLIDSAAAEPLSVCQRLETRPEGLTDDVAHRSPSPGLIGLHSDRDGSP